MMIKQWDSQLLSIKRIDYINFPINPTKRSGIKLFKL